MKATLAIVNAMRAKCGMPPVPRCPAPPVAATLANVSGPGRLRGRRGKSEPGKMELDYGDHLAFRMVAGEVDAYLFQAWGFRLGVRCYYWPDYVVWLPDGTVEAHEVKGHMEDDAAVKLRVFAEMYPTMGLVIVRRGTNGAWLYEWRNRPAAAGGR